MQDDAVKRLEEFANSNAQTQGKVTMAEEKRHNVFMRVTDPLVHEATGESDPVAVMAKLREMKNAS